MMNPKLRTAGIVVVVALLVLALAYVIVKFVAFQSVLNALPGEGSEVVFVEQGASTRYLFLDKVLVRSIEDPLQNGVVIRDRAAIPGTSDEAVLAFIPGVPGLVAGVLQEDGVLRALVAGDTNKANLVVREDGLIVFSASPAFLEEGEEQVPASLEEPAEDGVEEIFTAEAPTEVETVPIAPAFPQLVAVNANTGAIALLGLGYSPRIIEDGTLLAIAPEGVVKIDPATRARTVVHAFSVQEQGGSISPSGALVALPGPNATLEFFSLKEEPAYRGFLEREGGATYAVFVDDNYLFVRTGLDTARYYKAPTENLPIAAPVALLAITR